MSSTGVGDVVINRMPGGDTQVRCVASVERW